MSCSIIIQALSQLKKIYKDDWNSLTANCDTKLFLGCDDSETIKWLLEMLGKRTTTVANTSYNSNGSGSTSYNKSSIETLTIDQITMMQDDECIVRIRGKRPYYGKKYELTQHPNYEYAYALKGKYKISLSEEAKKIKERHSGPLRLRNLSMNKMETAVHDANAKKKTNVSLTKKERTQPKEEQRYNASELISVDENILATFAIDSNAMDNVIQEAVETMIELEQPSLEQITYGITN